MKKNAILISLATLACALTHANEDLQEWNSPAFKKPHCIDYGYDVIFGKDSHWRNEDVKQKDTYFLGGFKFGYDYIKPYSIYTGLQGSALYGEDRIFLVSGELKSPKMFVDAFIGNIEGRAGYTFQAKFFLFSPFFGVGRNIIKESDKEEKDTETQTYLSFGFRSNFTITPYFDIGLNVKAMPTITNHFDIKIDAFREEISDERRMVHHIKRHETGILDDFWGYEVSLPLTWSKKKNRKWEYRLEPYFLKLHAINPILFFGGRFRSTYHF